MIIGEEALDVSLLTDIPWFFGRVDRLGNRQPMIDLKTLDWADRWRVFWARLGAWYYVDSGSSD